ncbi:MAG: type II toxin-antitoxin system HicA family toxin [Thermodesulfovibrio sp.]|nr:type II toxin-antitoxin system HicA family toxin [Thermodesulfovibrio sp.]MDW7972428.1 type II toxin-antitoxin system HicA family toxin [Thermodesulfovibrio sp.]
MSVDEKFLRKLLSGLSDKNIRFEDLKKLLIDFGFQERVKGSHHIFFKSGVEEIINLQSLPDGKAKPYQVKQVRGLILKYKLHKGVIDV